MDEVLYFIKRNNSLTISPYWVNGNITNGVEDTYNAASRIRSNYLKVNRGTIITLESDITAYISVYTLEDKTYESATGWMYNQYVAEKECYIRVILRYRTETNYDSKTSLASKCVITLNAINKEVEILDLNDNVKDFIQTDSCCVSDYAWESGGFDATTGMETVTNVYSIRSECIRAYAGTVFKIVDKTNTPIMNVYKYSLTDKSFIEKFETTGLVDYYILDEDCYVRLTLWYETLANFDSILSLTSKVKIILNKQLKWDNFIGNTQQTALTNNVMPEWEQGTYDLTTGKIASSTTKVRTAGYIRAFPGMEIMSRIYIVTSIVIYSLTDKSFVSSASLGYNRYIITDDCYIALTATWSSVLGDTFDVDTLGSCVRVTYDRYKQYIPYYMDDDIASANAKLIQTQDRFNFIFFTDPHTFYQHTRGAVKLANFGQINCIIHGGDIIRTPINGAEATIKDILKHTTELKSSIAPIYMVKGNHDLSSDNVYTNTMWYNTCIRSFKTSDMIVNLSDPAGGYYYVDNETYKIRIIITNTCIDEINGITLNQTELQWLANVALDLSSKSDAASWNVIVVGHRNLLVDYNGSESTIPDSVQALADLLKAAKSRTSYINSTYGISVDYSVQSYTFIGYIFGHIHADVLEIPSDYGYVMASTACSDCSVPDNPTSSVTYAARTMDTNTEYAWDIFSIDLTNKIIYIYRVGAGDDRSISYT